MRAPNARTPAPPREGGSGARRHPQPPDAQPGPGIVGVVLDDDDPRPSGALEPAVFDLEPEPPGEPKNTRGRSPVKWRQSSERRQVVQHPEYGPSNWLDLGPGQLPVRVALLTGVLGLPVLAVILAVGATQWTWVAHLGAFVATLVVAGVAAWVTGRFVGRAHAVRCGWYVDGDGESLEVSPLLRVAAVLVPVSLWVVTLGGGARILGGTLLAVGCTLLATRVVRVTSWAWADMAAREDRAIAWLAGAPDVDPWAGLRQSWKQGPGAPDGRPLLRGSRLLNDADFAQLPGGGIKATVSLSPKMPGGWQALMAAAEREIVAREFGTTADLVFWGPHRTGARHATLIAHKRDPLAAPIPWRRPSLAGGRFVVARRADGGDAHWILNNRDMGTANKLVVGMTRSGKSSFLAIAGFEAGCSGVAWTELLDFKGGLSVPALAQPGRVDHLALTDRDIAVRVLTWHRVGMWRVEQQMGNRAPCTEHPAFGILLPDSLSPLTDGPYAAVLQPVMAEGLRLFGAVNLWAALDLQTAKADRIGGTDMRGQFRDAATLQLKNASDRQIMKSFHDGVEPVIPVTAGKGGAYVSSDDVPETLAIRARALNPDERAGAIADRHRAPIPADSPFREQVAEAAAAVEAELDQLVIESAQKSKTTRSRA